MNVERKESVELALKYATPPGLPRWGLLDGPVFSSLTAFSSLRHLEMLRGQQVIQSLADNLARLGEN